MGDYLTDGYTPSFLVYCIRLFNFQLLFFFIDTATPEIYTYCHTLPLHAALPISEGTLGVITRLVLRLRERPTSSNTAVVCAATFDQMVNLLRFVDQGFGGLLSAFELIDNSFYKVNTGAGKHAPPLRSEEHTSELQSLMRISYAVFCLKKKK